jgi:hypothetical protein
MRISKFVPVGLVILTVGVFADPVHAQAQAPEPQQPPPSIIEEGSELEPAIQAIQPAPPPDRLSLAKPSILEDWREGGPMPDGYHSEKRARRGMVIAGAVTFGVPYALSVIFGMWLGGYVGDGATISPELFFVPVLGPFLVLGQAGQVEGVVLLDGVAQLAGAVMLISGLAWPGTMLVRNDVARMSVVPMRFGKSGTGLGLAGTF